MEKVESRTRRTTHWDPNVEDQRIDLGLYVDNNEWSHSRGTNYNDKLDVHMNTNFEGFQNLLHITQKLVFHHQVVILNVKTIEWTSLSRTRSTLSHDQVTKWTKARARVYSDSVSC